MASQKILSILVVITAIAMILSSAAFLFPGGSQSQNGVNHNTDLQAVSSGILTNTASSTLSQKSESILQALHAKGVPNKDIYLPNFNAPQKTGNLVNQPSYTSAPAPMGIGTYGFSNNNGVITRNNISTSSFEASVSFNNFQTFYALDDGPNSVTVQLNSILSNVTLFGNSSYTFWNQNVLFYSARTQTIQFIDNIWNFSSPAFDMTPNVFNSYDGNLVAPYYYYAIGPAFSVSFPFTVVLYLNSTVINGENTVFFNYTVTTATGTTSGSFDEVQFNSVSGQPAGYSAPQANYFVTSYNVTPTGFIPYDSEIMIGGPGGGSTAMIYQINASMTLKYLQSGSYSNVPNAWDVGSETGETSTGAAVTWTPNAVAHLSAGPSFVYGMWNVSKTSNLQKFSGQVNPPNSFMFVSQGSSFNGPESTWSPLSQTGSYSFMLPAGKYAASVLLSNHDPITTKLASGSSQSFNLGLNYRQGVYTPLYAFGNSQLPYISSSGTGTAGNPYVLYNNPSKTGYLSPLFTTFNDYLFPQFEGVLLHSTSAYVVMNNMPAFSIQYTQQNQLLNLEFFGVQFTTNSLGYMLYDTQNAVLKNSLITGWFPNTLSEFPAANVLLWNSQNNLITGNHFQTMDSSMLIYNMHGQNGKNTVYDNLFLQDPNLNNQTYPGIAVLTTFGTSPYGPVALTVYSSSNTITGNSFIVYVTAISPYYSIYSGAREQYKNNWNGNGWWNYAPHSGIYDDNGLIYIGGDSHASPIPGYASYVTNFEYS